MSERTWKRAEREIAAVLGGTRVPITGRQRGDVPDVEQEWFAVEVKHRGRLPAFIHDAMDQAEAAAVGTDKVPLVVLHEKGMRYIDSYAMMRLDQLTERLLDENKKPKTLWGRVDGKAAVPRIKSLEDILAGLGEGEL